MDHGWQQYQNTLASELGPELAHEFTHQLYTESRGCIQVASHFFYTLGTHWAALMHAWGSWIQVHAQGTPALILRDAKPLSVLHLSKQWKRLYLNRPICGIPDELSGDMSACRHPYLDRYLTQSGCAKYFTFVDSGCYGTVVLQLHNAGLNFQPLFFFSKNPNIAGFLNHLGLSMTDGEILNDSLECCFPHIYKRPTELVEIHGSIQPDLHATDMLSVKFGMAAMDGIRQSERQTAIHPARSVETLLSLSHRTRLGEFTGILGHTSPEWSKKNEFLRNWPKHLCWV